MYSEVYPSDMPPLLARIIHPWFLTQEQSCGWMILRMDDTAVLPRMHDPSLVPYTGAILRICLVHWNVRALPCPTLPTNLIPSPHLVLFWTLESGISRLREHLEGLEALEAGCATLESEVIVEVPSLLLQCKQAEQDSWKGQSNGVGVVTRLPGTFDDSDPTTRCVYARPSQLCLLGIRMKYMCAERRERNSGSEVLIAPIILKL